MRAFDKRRVARDFARPRPNAALAETMQRSLEQKHAAQAQVAWQALRQRAHAIKAYTIANLGALLTQFEREFGKRGGTVLWAHTAAEAAGHVLDICREHGANAVVKGKSMVSEELDLNAMLAAHGVDPVETDLGEYIVQLAGQRPSHLIAPAAHLSRADVGELFAEELGVAYTESPEELVKIARDRLRRRYLEAQVGITGVNFAIAETGTIVVVENEGNGGLSAAAPRAHVALMGIEKLLPRAADLLVFLQLLARAATGQKLTTYTHHFLGADDGAKLYCILVDAGRTEILADPKSRESLYCIRCGACLSACPIYRRVGGWAYGGAYGGPIGAVITPHMAGVTEAGELPFASSLCGACGEECPVDIDLPHQLAHMRERAVTAGATEPAVERNLLAAWFRAMQSLGAYRRAIAVARLAAGVARASPWKPSFLGAWAGRREVPRVAPQTFKEWWRRRR